MVRSLGGFSTKRYGTVMATNRQGPGLRHRSPVAFDPAVDPRIARTHAAVMQAATDLLVEGGPSALTMDAVVARSGVAKSTLYRHWATRDDLVADVFEHCAPELDPIPADATCEEGLRALVRSAVRALADEHWSRLAPALLLLSSQLPDLEKVDSAMKQAQHDQIEGILRRGVEEGVLGPWVVDDVERSLVLLAGPVVAAGLAHLGPLDDALADRSVAQFLAGNHPR